LVLALMPFQTLFTESSHGDQLLASSPFSSVLSASPFLCYVLVFSSLCIAQFFERGSQSAQGTMLVYPRCGLGKPHDSWCSPVGLLNVS
jgi:hypothetical protein